MAKKIAMGFAHGGLFLLAVIVFLPGTGCGPAVQSGLGDRPVGR